MFAAISALTTTLHYEKHKSKVTKFTQPLHSHLLTIMLVSMLALNNANNYKSYNTPYCVSHNKTSLYFKQQK